MPTSNEQVVEHPGNPEGQDQPNQAKPKQAEITYHWDPAEPDRVHLWIKTDLFTDEHGQRPGLWLVFSANPKSADYSPANFNRVVRRLRAEGRPHPAEVEEHDRRLRTRPKLIADYRAI